MSSVLAHYGFSHAGTYQLEFTIPDFLEAEAVSLQLRIVPCPKGYVTASGGDACSLCVKGYFSFDPASKECTMCVPNAQCSGGDALWPAHGFWHSASQSTQMHR